MMTCTAKELCAATGGTLVQDGEGFSCVSTDSRRVEQGCLFIPLVGERFDGHTYLTQALESGAAGCLCSRLPEALVPGKFYHPYHPELLPISVRLQSLEVDFRHIYKYG